MFGIERRWQRHQGCYEPDNHDDLEHGDLLSPGSQGGHDDLVPLPGDGQQCQDRHTDGEVGAELADGAAHCSKHPLIVPHEEEGGHTVEQRHSNVSN